MREVMQIRYEPTGKPEPVYMPITDAQACILYYRGLECFDTMADAQWWLIRYRKPSDSLVLASVLERGGFALIGYANLR